MSVDSTFDREAFRAALRTRRLGHELIARHSVESTNDVVWDALAQGAADGTVVVADVQTRGRGRLGRTWHTPSDVGLAMSTALHPGCDARAIAVVPLAAGLALSRAVTLLGGRPELKWPNDVLLDGRKVSGILCEGRRAPSGEDVVVIGVGVNVGQQAEDFPEDVRSIATSLRMAGVETSREAVAAAFFNAFEPLWMELEEAGAGGVLAAWQEQATFWGGTLTVTTPRGAVSGKAVELSADGGLVLETAAGTRTTVLAGDVGAPA